MDTPSALHSQNFESDRISTERVMGGEFIWVINLLFPLNLLLNLDGINWFNDLKSKLYVSFINQ
jgi:hypothetical protein